MGKKMQWLIDAYDKGVLGSTFKFRLIDGGKDYGTVRNYSEEIAKEIDEEVNRIVMKGYDRCEKILNEHIDKLHALAQYLMEHEKIDGENFVKLMDGTEDPSERSDS